MILIKNSQFYMRIKYIDIQYHYVRKQIIVDIIVFKYIFINK